MVRAGQCRFELLDENDRPLLEVTDQQGQVWVIGEPGLTFAISVAIDEIKADSARSSTSRALQGSARESYQAFFDIDGQPTDLYKIVEPGKWRTQNGFLIVKNGEVVGCRKFTFSRVAISEDEELRDRGIGSISAHFYRVSVQRNNTRSHPYRNGEQRFKPVAKAASTKFHELSDLSVTAGAVAEYPPDKRAAFNEFEASDHEPVASLTIHYASLQVLQIKGLVNLGNLDHIKLIQRFPDMDAISNVLSTLLKHADPHQHGVAIEDLASLFETITRQKLFDVCPVPEEMIRRSRHLFLDAKNRVRIKVTESIDLTEDDDDGPKRASPKAQAPAPRQALPPVMQPEEKTVAIPTPALPNPTAALAPAAPDKENIVPFAEISSAELAKHRSTHSVAPSRRPKRKPLVPSTRVLRSSTRHTAATGPDNL